MTLVLGGKGANQAIAGSLAGADAYLVGCVGNDLFRDLVIDGLTGYGVDVSETREVDGPTGLAHIRVDRTGENDIVMVPLANNHITRSHIDASLERLHDRASVLIAQLEVPADVACHAIKMAKELGMTVVLDPAPAMPLEPAIWQFIDIVTPNETEAGLITGIEVTGLDSAVEAGQWFLAQGTAHAVITLASSGAVLVSSKGTKHFAPFPVSAVDTTAAGDAFTGYLGASIAQGLGLDDAIVLAMAAGALAVTKRGASPSLPQRAAVDALLAEQQ
jgi:ribokinase